MILKMVTLVLIFSGVTSFAADEDQPSIDACIQAWKTSPFKIGTAPHKVIEVGVKVFGIGSATSADTPTAEPSLVLVKPSVNVLGKTKLELTNPNGWYCLKSSVNVLGKLSIIADCKAHIESANGKDVNVLGANQAKNGVTVLGTIRLEKTNCH